MTTLKQLYTTHSILNILDLLKLSVAKFMYCFDIGELMVKHCGCNVGSVFTRVYWSQIWFDIPKNLRSVSPYSFKKQYKIVLLSCQNAS